MTAQEQQMLQDLTDRINQTQLQEKDPEAEQFLNGKLGRNPDALYIMAQTTLVQGYALEQAQKQLADARTQLQQLQQQPKHTTSFLGNLLGMKDDASAPPPPPAQSQPQYAPVANYGTPSSGSYYAQQQPQYGASQQYVPPQGGGAFQQGGFLRSAMQTATGVAAGALAFEGIESLMHGFGGHSGGGMGQGFGGFEGGAAREEIINNYYGESGPGDRQEHGRDFSSDDVEDRRGDSPRFADTGSDSDNNDDNSPDDTSSSDDTSGNDGFDPGGNDDSF